MRRDELRLRVVPESGLSASTDELAVRRVEPASEASARRDGSAGTDAEGLAETLLLREGSTGGGSGGGGGGGARGSGTVRNGVERRCGGDGALVVLSVHAEAAEEEVG